MTDWITWLAVFCGVLAVISIAAAVQEFIAWRKDRKRR